jgi:hypothetical protein
VWRVEDDARAGCRDGARMSGMTPRVDAPYLYGQNRERGDLHD